MKDNTNILLHQRLKELQQQATTKYQWLVKNSSSPCFGDVMREYNILNQRIELLNQRLNGNSGNKTTVEMSSVSRQSANCFTSIHN